jgi:hypothetical protein
LQSFCRAKKLANSLRDLRLGPTPRQPPRLISNPNPGAECLLVASAERLYCFEPGGSLRWMSQGLGIDGVTVDEFDANTVRGQGEWDPPGGWQQFQLDMRTGQLPGSGVIK